MKINLPSLSALALLAVVAVAIAQRQLASRSEEPRLIAVNASAADQEATAPYSTKPAPIAPVAAATADELPVGDRLLLQAIDRLEQRKSIVARLRHQVSLDGNQFYGVGSYWQQGKGEDLQLRMELQMAGQDASLLQASNGRFLWVDRRLPTGRAVTRIDLRAIRAELQSTFGTKSSDDELTIATNDWAQPTEPANVNPPAADLLLLGAGGGLRGLLASLAENFAFLPPQAMRLAVGPPLTAQPMEVPVFAVVGHWKQERLVAIAGSEESRVESSESEVDVAESIPERFPQEVLLLVGQADLFPYRVEYRRHETPVAAGGRAATSIYRLSANPILVLELTEVRFDVPIAAGPFDYAPGSAEWTDQTAVLLERLRSERRQQLAERVRTNPSALPR
jgi:hypothetical protein